MAATVYLWSQVAMMPHTAAMANVLKATKRGTLAGEGRTNLSPRMTNALTAANRVTKLLEVVTSDTPRESRFDLRSRSVLSSASMNAQ